MNDTSPIAFIFLQFAFGVSAGFCAVTARSVGAHDEAAVRRSLRHRSSLSAALTVALTALALVLLNPMLAWINLTPASGEVYRAAFTYCAIIFAGIGAQLFYNFICSFLRSLGDSVTPLLFLLFSTALNVGLDLLFIVTFRWGVAGAAIATVLAQLPAPSAASAMPSPAIQSSGSTARTGPSRDTTSASTPFRASRSGCSSPCWPSASSSCRVLL